MEENCYVEPVYKNATAYLDNSLTPRLGFLLSVSGFSHLTARFRKQAHAF